MADDRTRPDALFVPTQRHRFESFKDHESEDFVGERFFPNGRWKEVHFADPGAAFLSRSKDKPAQYRWNPDGTLRTLAFYNEEGRLHRDPKKGPSVIERGADDAFTEITNSDYIANAYFTHGSILDRDPNDGPALISVEADTLELSSAEYRVEGRLHRMNGPAQIEPDAVFDDEREQWFREGKPYQPTAHERLAWEKIRAEENAKIKIHIPGELLPRPVKIDGKSVVLATAAGRAFAQETREKIEAAERHKPNPSHHPIQQPGTAQEAVPATEERTWHQTYRLEGPDRKMIVMEREGARSTYNYEAAPNGKAKVELWKGEKLHLIEDLETAFAKMRATGRGAVADHFAKNTAAFRRGGTKPTWDDLLYMVDGIEEIQQGERARTANAEAPSKAPSSPDRPQDRAAARTPMTGTFTQQDFFGAGIFQEPTKADPVKAAAPAPVPLKTRTAPAKEARMGLAYIGPGSRGNEGMPFDLKPSASDGFLSLRGALTKNAGMTAKEAAQRLNAEAARGGGIQALAFTRDALRQRGHHAFILNRYKHTDIAWHIGPPRCQWDDAAVGLVVYTGSDRKTITLDQAAAKITAHLERWNEWANGYDGRPEPTLNPPKPAKAPAQVETKHAPIPRSAVPDFMAFDLANGPAVVKAVREGGDLAAAGAITASYDGKPKAAAPARDPFNQDAPARPSRVRSK